MPNKRDLGSLVSGAGDDITPPGPMRRGGGLNSMIAGGGEPAAPPPVEAPAPPAALSPKRQAATAASPQAESATTPHADMSTSLQVARRAAPTPRSTASPGTRERKVASYRIDTELARRVKIYAAMYDLNDYEVVERALTEYLDRHPRGPGIG